MYYYGNNYGYGTNQCFAPSGYSGYAGYTTGAGVGAAIWIVLFILLVIIIGAGWFGSGQKPCN